MEIASIFHRLHFAFTITYHYLFPQLTMGLALLIVIMKVLALKRGDERYNSAARFWARIFAVNFVMGVVTGIPMEFQFGTNWARFSAAAGGVIGQTLGMEGVIAFFLESSFLGLFLFGEKKLGPKGHLVLEKGVVRAQRHVVMNPAEAAYYGVKAGDPMDLVVNHPTCGSTVHGLIVRIGEKLKLEIHIDTDEFILLCTLPGHPGPVG